MPARKGGKTNLAITEEKETRVRAPANGIQKTQEFEEQKSQNHETQA